jgi:isoleucyl-tRNA synthetase
VGLAAHNRAPYKAVVTHGWTLDAQGRAMHKSAGNAVEPDVVIKESGAEIIRLWCASSNYFDDMRASGEILQRVTDGYRKLRNTARFALGNLHGFDPDRDSVNDDELEEIDRWALSELRNVLNKVLSAYDSFEFHLVYHALYNFATVTLSARYFDIIKDRLYTYAPRNKARRSAQTALHRIADGLARALAPILVFTADEIWENLPEATSKAQSVHLAEFPRPAMTIDEELGKNWEELFVVRDEVLRALEEARVAKEIGSSLEAKVTLTASGGTLALLKKYETELRYVFIVSQVNVQAAEGNKALGISVSKADGEKCERCWNYSTRVGESEKYPTVCERCVSALEEIESAG